MMERKPVAADVQTQQKLVEIASLAARLHTSERAGDRLRAFLREPPEYGKITLCFAAGKLFRVIREES